MSKLDEKIAKLKEEYPVLTKAINDQTIELNAEEYDATIQSWAENELAKEEAEALALEKKTNAEAKLAALGLTPEDIKALGII